MGKDKVKVGVRVRPLNAREKALMPDGSLVVRVNRDTNQIILSNPTHTSNATNNNNNVNNSNTTNSTKKSFTFDHVFGMEVDQEEIFDRLGEDLLGSAFEGYNACLFAYGQTGSGKSYTMLGSADNRGVIPRLCDAMFNKIAEETANLNNSSALAASTLPPEIPNDFKVEVSFMEIYNEKVRDLLVANKTSLKVREHSILGPYVDGLSLLAVKSAEDIANLMAEGNKSRTVAATNMNSESSRSHAVFTIVLTQTMTDTSSGVTGEKVSRISLVDLAGSERAAKTGAVGERLKEGSNINKSLTTLGLVISKLAEGSSGGGGREDKKNFIPYRDSVLTWLLKDNLGGNSRTIMIATVSPSPDNYEETLSTLRYADRAKKIVNNAVVNEDPNAKLIRELQAEVKQLRELLKSHVSDKVLNDKLNQSEKLMRQVSETWEEKLQRSEQATQERQAALEKMGISVQQSGISVEKDRFYLVNLNADPALNELLVYYLKEDRTVVGRPDASSPPDIQLTGLGIEQLHCELVIDQQQDQTLYLIPYPKAHTCVNGERIERRRVLHHGDRILWGNHHFFRLNSPVKTAPQQQQQQVQQAGSGSTVQSGGSVGASSGGTGNVVPTSLEIASNSYELASAEFSMKQLIMSDPIHEAVAKLESKHQKDKQVALEKQRQELERQFNALMHVLSPSSPLPPGPLPWDSHGNYLQQNSSLHNSISSNQINALSTVGGGGTASSSSSAVAQHQNARNNKIAEGLKLLKDFLLKANQMVREANEIASAMKIAVKYRVTLLIPPNNLTPNRPKGSLVAEPSIRVERDGYYPQIWSMEKLQNRLVDMREMYEDYCSQHTSKFCPSSASSIRDVGEGDQKDEEIRTSSSVAPTSGVGATHSSELIISDSGPPATFFEPDQPHILLGIANVFLQALFYDDVTLKYAVPVINQQGEIVGRLHVEVAKISGTMDTSSNKFGNSSMNLGGGGGLLQQSNSSFKLDSSLYEEYEDAVEEEDPLESKTVTVKVTVRHLAGVSSSHSVFCQYVFCDNIVVVPPTSTTSVIRFDHTRYFTIPVSEEFIDYCSESALSVEVWGTRGIQPNSQLEGSANGQQQSNNSNGGGGNTGSGETNNNSVTDRWKEVTSQVKLWVEVQELNENGEYVPVDVEYAGGAGTGGVHLLRQGLQRRILITVETSASVGQLPVVCDEIDQVSLGAITPRSTTLQRPLDSYQEEDLTLLREKWGEALKRRREYLDAHLQELANKSEKSEEEQNREKSLVSQWLTLTEERNAVLVPTPDSGVPGAPTNSSFKPEPGMEQHMPIIFLDIAEDILSAESSPHSPPLVTGNTAGLNSLLPKEHDSQFVALPMHKKSYGDFYSAWSDQRMTTESWALVSWDSSVHDCIQLNKPTPPGEVIYVILRVALRLSHPVQMEVVLRKRVCLMVRKNRSSFSERLRARFTMRKPEDLDQERSKKRTGVTYQVVSHLPKSSEQLETRESLASLAVSHGENYIEEYLRSVSAVDSILNLDRMRQSVYLREEQMKSRPQKLNRSFQHQNGVSGGNSPASMSGFMRKTLSVPNISQLFVGSGGAPTTGNSGLGSNMKFTHINGNPLSPSTPIGQTPDVGGMSNGGMPRRIKPIRSESLANLSGFAKSSGQDLLSPPSNSQAQQQQQQSPSQTRPSSLNLGNSMSGGGSTTPHSTKWTSMMTTVMEEESSGYGSQKSSEESPTTTG